MQSQSRRRSLARPALGLAVLGLACLLPDASARAQSAPTPTGPKVPNIEQRSGLLTRFVPIQSRLPVDGDRDKFYDTRWADYPEVTHPNWLLHGGMYGLRWPSSCTRCTPGSFPGAPGADTLGPDCKPHSRVFTRVVTNAFCKYKPVGEYYASGCYVPVYDFDYWVPGPGSWPWPFFLRRPFGG